jgi:hypothetical protein
MAALAAIPEEEIWLQKQKSARHCSCFYDGPAVADDPLARRRPFELGPPRSGIR